VSFSIGFGGFGGFAGLADSLAGISGFASASGIVTGVAATEGYEFKGMGGGGYPTVGAEICAPSACANESATEKIVKAENSIFYRFSDFVVFLQEM
jgi:hypothetical protein